MQNKACRTSSPKPTLSSTPSVKRATPNAVARRLSITTAVAVPAPANSKATVGPPNMRMSSTGHIWMVKVTQTSQPTNTAGAAMTNPAETQTKAIGREVPVIDRPRGLWSGHGVGGFAP